MAAVKSPALSLEARHETRKFTVGNRVGLLLEHHPADSPADDYEVSRMLPGQAGVWHYRVKRIGDGQERAVSEPQLLGIEPLKMVPEIGAQQEQQRIRNARASERAQALARRDERRH
jgi:hypothetical protein